MALPVIVAVAAAAGVGGFWVTRKKEPPKKDEPFVIDEHLAPAVKDRVQQLLGSPLDEPKLTQIAREMGTIFSVGCPHTSQSLRRKLWEVEGRNGPPPSFDDLPIGDARVAGYEPTRDYTTGHLGFGPGPEGLDPGIPDATIREVRKRLGESAEERVHPEARYVSVLAAFADELDTDGFSLAAEAVRSKANYCKRQEVAKGNHPMSFTYRLDANLPADVREFVEWSLDNNRRPEQLEAVACHFADGYAWTSYQLRRRAHQLRVGAA